MNEEVYQCFHTDIMNKYIFPVQQKIYGNFKENFLEIFRNIFFRKSYITIQRYFKDTYSETHARIIIKTSTSTWNKY